MKCAASGILHSAEDVSSKRFDLTKEIVPEISNTVGKWKGELESFLDNKEMRLVEDVSVVTKPQRQISHLLPLMSTYR